MKGMTLTFRTVEQAALFQVELKGQLSDGHWENSRPWDHWRPWCDAQILVGSPVGRNFGALKDNYDFTSKVLLDVVGNRMQSIVKLARKYGVDDARFLEEFVLDLEGDFRGVSDWMLKDAKERPDGHYARGLRALEEEFDLDEVRSIVEADTYSMRELRQDLQEMKSTVRILVE